MLPTPPTPPFKFTSSVVSGSGVRPNIPNSDRKKEDFVGFPLLVEIVLSVALLLILASIEVF